MNTIKNVLSRNRNGDITMAPLCKLGRGDDRSYSSAPRGGRSARFFARVVRIYIRWNVVTMNQQSATSGAARGASSDLAPHNATKRPIR